MSTDIFAKIGDIKGEVARCQAQGRNRGAVVLLGRDPTRYRPRTVVAAAKARPPSTT